MNLSQLSARAAFGLAVCSLSFAPPVTAQSPTENFHKAYFLEHEAHDLESALGLYRQVAKNRRAPAELRQQAASRARAVTEELASADFAQLVPADTIFYLEFNRPGEQLRTLLGQLGLLGAGQDRFGISPLLVEGMLGMRGAAVAITEIDPRQGPSGGVAIIHPGELDVVRGLIETALPVGGQPVEPIGDYATYSIEGEAYVTLTSRLLIAGRHREDIAGVIGRMQNDGRGSLAQNQRLAGAMSMRGKDLMFFCLNLEPVMPMIMDAIAKETRRDPEIRAALAFVDLPSARTIAGRAGVDESGMSFDMVVELDEGHRSLAFNLMRMPNIDEQALSLVPAGPAFFCVGAVNRAGAVPPGETDSEGKPVVTLMDFGREFFANVADVAAFVMPQVQRAPWGAMPDVGLAMRVNDPQRSVALWQFLLGTAQAATGGKAPAAPQQSGEVVVHRYDIEGVPVFLAQDGNHLVLSPSERLIGSAIASARNGESVLKDPAYADALALADNGSTMVAAANLGRCSEIGKHFMSARERREMEPFVDLMQDTTMSFGLLQTANRCGVRGRITGIPDVGPMLSQLINQELHGGRPRSASRRRASVGAAPRREVVRDKAAPRPTTSTAIAAQTNNAASLRDRFQQAHEAGKTEQARKLALTFGSGIADDPLELNNFAWALLTEEQYGQHYDNVARQLSKISNESAGWNNWYYLDTYARALFQSGSVDEAIKMQRKAIEVGADDPRIGEARQSLEQYVEAAKKRRITRGTAEIRRDRAPSR